MPTRELVEMLDAVTIAHMMLHGVAGPGKPLPVDLDDHARYALGHSLTVITNTLRRLRDNVVDVQMAEDNRQPTSASSPAVSGPGFT